MANRAAAAGRPGGRFAQFKLVLLGEEPSFRRINRSMLMASSGESAVGKVRATSQPGSPLLLTL